MRYEVRYYSHYLDGAELDDGLRHAIIRRQARIHIRCNMTHLALVPK